MKKGIILLALLFTACVNLENIGGNSGGDVKEIKTTNINTTKNYEKRNGVLYVDNVLANGKQEYKEKNGVVIRGNYREGLPDGIQEKYYPSGKIYGKINIINNKTEGTETNYYENGKTLSQLDYTQGKLISGKIYYENGDLLSKIEGKKMTILGAGGAATAIIAQAALDNAEEIFVFTRQSSYEKTVRKMAAISRQTKSSIQVLTLEDADSLQDTINQSDLLVNGTSLGMDGISMPLPEQLELPDQILVADVIYQPFETPFLKWARNQNVTAVNGLGMLLYQGAEAFELWTGKTMPSQEIWQCLEELYNN